MNDILRPYLHKFILVFFDDILVYSKDVQAHAEHLHTVFQLLQANNLVLNWKKCDFAVSQVEYLGRSFYSRRGSRPTQTAAMR